MRYLIGVIVMVAILLGCTECRYFVGGILMVDIM